MNIYNSFLFFIVLMLKSPRLQPAGAPLTGSGAAVTCHLFIYLLLASWHSEMFQAHCCRSGPKSGPFSQEPWLLSVGGMLGTKVGCWGGCPPCPPRTPTHVCAPPTRRQTHIQADARRCTLEKSHIHTCPADRSLPDPCGCSPLPGTPQGVLRGAASMSQQRKKPQLKTSWFVPGGFVLAVRRLPLRPRRGPGTGDRGQKCPGFIFHVLFRAGRCSFCDSAPHPLPPALVALS